MTERLQIDRGILEKRAAELAKPLGAMDQADERVALLEFSLLGTRYAVPLEKVEAVSRIGEIFSIPLTPRHISGIIRRRGQSVALVSLRHFFHTHAEGIADADFAVYVVAQEKLFAIQVEEIHGVMHMAKGSLLPPPENFDPAQAPFMVGVTIDGLSVIDLEALVDAEGFSTSNR